MKILSLMKSDRRRLMMMLSHSEHNDNDEDEDNYEDAANAKLMLVESA